MRIRVNDSWLELVEGDITQQEVDAIVNAANSSLRGGGGVDGAIHRAGGPQIMAEASRYGGCPTGEARITSGGRLKARYVIHAVGPVYRDGRSGEAELLASAYRYSMRLASEHRIESIAFPAISAGAYGYPLPEAATIALRTVIAELRQRPEIKLARFVLFGRNAYDAFAAALQALLPLT